ncbi:S8 family serine peptidase [Paenibacillus sp. y28]|uniref:S8 family serine peptidase n=1 Tax=Paenibacillus sp. y28 TaxID=3129110 RepID=UPI003015E75A
MSAAPQQAAESQSAQADSWILKWNSEPPAEFWHTSERISTFKELGVDVVRPAEGVDPREWRVKWAGSAQVKYMLPNRELSSLAAANDPFFSRQTYLKQIQAEAAWDIATGNEGFTIAMIDTGVDLQHPDLQANLVSGYNVIDPEQPPLDDNGHGTNVAGVMAAAGNNGTGVTGLLWRAKLMPIKALEQSGRGDEAKLAEGIRYAVNHGAKVVVMSVGLPGSDPFLQEVVEYAEAQNVLLVAATGNDEGEMVRFPAAYPSVLAVGGITGTGEVEERSNYGPEVDLVAPWLVYTTAQGGGYEYRDGTSMAAPQAAAVAALVWQQHPDWTAAQIRNHMRGSSQDVGAPGWDEHTGYGQLRADLALTQAYIPDLYEPNETKASAAVFPLNTMITAELSGSSDKDWYSMKIPYDGQLHLTLQADQPDALPMTMYVEYDGKTMTQDVTPGKQSTLTVRKGTVFVRIAAKNAGAAASSTYRLSSSFDIYADPYEDNDRQYKAYALPARTQTITGTFHRRGDQDWFVVKPETSGIMRVRASTDSPKIDLALLIQKQGERALTIDAGGQGQPEYAPQMEVLPGTYYIRVTNASDLAAAAEYFLSLEFVPKLVDPNEPNNKAYQATDIRFDYPYQGIIDTADDADWFRFKLTEDSLAQFRLTGLPEKADVSYTIYNSSLEAVTSGQFPAGTGSAAWLQPFAPGSYYIKLTANSSFSDQLYELQVSQAPLVSGYIDIADHWAKTEIAAATEEGWVNGYGEYMFMPNRTITRAEAAAMLVRAFGLSRQMELNYTDLAADHWAYEAIAAATRKGILQGYPDQTIGPDKPLTRIEMASMFAGALGISGKLRGQAPFVDIPESHWGASILKQMKAEGWLNGFDDGTFRPDEPATRAEFVVLLERIHPQ